MRVMSYSKPSRIEAYYWANPMKWDGLLLGYIEWDSHPEEIAGDIPGSIRSGYRFYLLQEWKYGWWFARYNLSR